MSVFTGTTPVLDTPAVGTPITTEGVIYKFQASSSMTTGKVFSVDFNRSKYVGFSFQAIVGIEITASLGVYSLLVYDTTTTTPVALGWSTGSGPITFTVSGEMDTSAVWTVDIDLVQGANTYSNTFVLNTPSAVSPTPQGFAIARINIKNESGGPTASALSWTYWTTGLNPLLRIPDQVVLSSPADTATDVPVNSVLRWLAAARADSYRVQLSKDSGMAAPLYIDDSGLLVLYRNASGRLDLNTLYYWRARASNAAGDGPWSDIWEFTTVSSVDGDCPYIDNVFTFNATIKSDNGSGYFTVAAGHHDNISVFLCSNDSLSGKVFAVALRTRDGRWFVTTCSRINYGKLYKQEDCKDLYCKALHYLFCGEMKKSTPGILDKVSIGTVISSGVSTATVNSVIGRITIENDFGSSFSVGQEVVIFNPDKTNNFAKVLGPTT